MGDLKERARAWYERAFYSDDTRSQCIDSLTTLLAEVRTERSACGHLLAEVQGEDGGMRWGSAGAGCNATATRDRATPLTPPRSRGWKRGSSEH